MTGAQLTQLLQSAVFFGTVIMYGSIGEILTEKSGNLNLGVPGIMYLGGIAGLAASFFYEINTENPSAIVCLPPSFIAVAGASHTISTSTAGGRGFTAIIVAWLAQFNSFVMILISFLLVFLQKGAIEIASQFNLNDYASNVITGIILFFILGSEFFINYRVILRSGKEGEAK